LAGNDDETTPPGWYRQKDDPGTLRWWDGDGWTDDHMPLPPATAKARPNIRIGDGGRGRGDAWMAAEVATRARPAEPVPARDPRRQVEAVHPPTVRPPTGRAPSASQAPPTGQAPPARAARRSTGSGRKPGSTRPSPPPGDERPRTATWPDVAGREVRRRDVEASHHVVERHSVGLSPLGRVLVRTVLICAVLGAGFLGYTKVRDAQPGDADTLTAKPAPVGKEGRGVKPLKDIALTLNDLPAGWAKQTFDPGADDICQGRIPRSVLVPFEVQSSSFTKGASGPFITDVAMRFVNAGTAEDFMALTAQTVDACRSYDDNGSTITLRPFSFPKFGDETFAVKATGTSPYGALDGDIIYLRRGDRVVSIQTISFGTADVSNELVAFLTQLVDRRLRVGAG
jgi:hypothetical protein